MKGKKLRAGYTKLRGGAPVILLTTTTVYYVL